MKKMFPLGSVYRFTNGKIIKPQCHYQKPKKFLNKTPVIYLPKLKNDKVKPKN